MARGFAQWYSCRAATCVADIAKTRYLGHEHSTAQEMTVPEIMSVLERGRPYFDSSGGGVTFSGGEPLLQIDFLCELLKASQKNIIPYGCRYFALRKTLRGRKNYTLYRAGPG
jgi:pyruvate-formate lyase-activating enzyme